MIEQRWDWPAHVASSFERGMQSSVIAGWSGSEYINSYYKVLDIRFLNIRLDFLFTLTGFTPCRPLSEYRRNP